ncbi:MAG: hypothetical protein JNL61_08300, partial [Rhizobiaceae bacterium]|nr:hypothetical protein [Rhizobiaceae bacterium]
EAILGSGNDQVIGSGGNDTISGGGGSDTISGGDGDDSISGGAGDDFLNGGDGDDFIAGGSGDDIIQGGSGDDTILGGSGDDTIDDAAGNDSIDAGAGNDTVNDVATADTINMGTGDDVLNLIGSNSVQAGENQIIDGGSGDDVLNVVGIGATTIIDQSDGSVAGFETVNIDGYRGAAGTEVTFIVDRAAFMGTADVNFYVGSGYDNNDAFVAEGNENSNDSVSVSGLDFNDYSHASFGVKGGTGVFGNLIAVDGLSGNDTVSASTGPDDNLGEILIGGLGNDVLDGGDRRSESGGDQTFGHMLFGGRGDDTISGSEGSDLFHGGYGNDTHNMLETSGGDLIDDGEDYFVFDFDGDDNRPNAAASANVEDGDGFDTVTGFTVGEDTLVLLMSESGGDNSMAGYLQNPGSKIVFAADASGVVDVQFLLDVDGNGTADAGITFNDFFKVGDAFTTNADFDDLNGGAPAVTLTGGNTTDGLQAGETITVTGLVDPQFGGLLGLVSYGMTFQNEINPFEGRAYDPLGEGFAHWA